MVAGGGGVAGALTGGVDSLLWVAVVLGGGGVASLLSGGVLPAVGVLSLKYH